MYSEFFKLFMLANSIFIFLVSIYLIFSKKNEPVEYTDEFFFSKKNEPVEYTDEFSKTYTLKPRKKIN